MAQSTSVEAANLPDGEYTLTIANDISGEWLIAHGLGSSGLSHQCSETGNVPAGAETSDTITVHSTPPDVATPTVRTEDKTAL